MAQLSPLLIAHPHTVSATGVQDFPLELIEHTIDHLHDDRVSLAACTVVCKAWTAPSHYHLFSTLHIIAGADHQRLRQFADFIPSSKFACEGVRHLYLSHSSNDTEPPLTELEGAAPPDFDVGLLTSLLYRMSRLQSLTIVQACWKESSFSSILDEPKLHLPRLTKLTIGPLPFFHKVYHIQFIFDWFPSLRQLSIREGLLVDPRIAMGTAFIYPVPPPLVLPTTLRLTTLAYYSFIYADFFLESISGTLSTQSLRFLSVRITSLQSVISVGKLLRIVGPVLEGLSLDLQFLFHNMTHVSSVDHYNEGWIRLNLMWLTVLQSLTLTISTSTANDDRVHTIGTLLIPLLLENIQSPNVRRFKLTFGDEEKSTLSFIDIGNDWRSTEVQLLRWKALERVEFAYSPVTKFSEGCPITEAIYDCLKVVLPTLASKGLLNR